MPPAFDENPQSSRVFARGVAPRGTLITHFYACIKDSPRERKRVRRFLMPANPDLTKALSIPPPVDNHSGAVLAGEVRPKEVCGR